jgi:hypothetical protein
LKCGAPKQRGLVRPGLLAINSKAAPHKFLPQQLGLLDEHSFLGKNHKLAPKWTGPHKILCLKGDANVDIQLKHNGQKTVVHANRLKPYFVASKNSAVFTDNFPTAITLLPRDFVQLPLDDQNFLSPKTTLQCTAAFFLHTRRSHQLSLPLPLVNFLL